MWCAVDYHNNINMYTHNFAKGFFIRTSIKRLLTPVGMFNNQEKPMILFVTMHCRGYF